LKNNSIDYCISTITLQHICVWELTNKIFISIYKCLKNKGIFNFQITFSKKVKSNNFILKILSLLKGFFKRSTYTEYGDNFYDATKTNGYSDMVVTDKKKLINDLKKIGFKKVSIKVTKSFSDVKFHKWIYVKCVK